MRSRFWGGVHPAGRKELSADVPPTPCPPPKQVVIPLQQHIGKPCTPLVKAGDMVKMGQRIGDGEGMCAPVHASVSGRVRAVEACRHPSGFTCPAVVIENDGQDAYASELAPIADPASLDADGLIGRIHGAGIVGMGGATSPTDI